MNIDIEYAGGQNLYKDQFKFENYARQKNKNENWINKESILFPF